jgi:hypothetical protein
VVRFVPSRESLRQAAAASTGAGQRAAAAREASITLSETFIEPEEEQEPEEKQANPKRAPGGWQAQPRKKTREQLAEEAREKAAAKVAREVEVARQQVELLAVAQADAAARLQGYASAGAAAAVLGLGRHQAWVAPAVPVGPAATDQAGPDDYRVRVTFEFPSPGPRCPAKPVRSVVERYMSQGRPYALRHTTRTGATTACV